MPVAFEVLPASTNRTTRLTPMIEKLFHTCSNPYSRTGKKFVNPLLSIAADSVGFELLPKALT